MFENLVEVLKANPRKIVYTEGTDARILESAARLKQGGFLTPILVGNVEEVKANAAKGDLFTTGDDYAAVQTEAGGQIEFGLVQPQCNFESLVQVFVIKSFEVVE